jgi:hypothetical protein
MYLQYMISPYAVHLSPDFKCPESWVLVGTVQYFQSVVPVQNSTQ